MMVPNSSMWTVEFGMSRSAVTGLSVEGLAGEAIGTDGSTGRVPGQKLSWLASACLAGGTVELVGSP